MKKAIFTKNAPKPIGPYSQAIAVQGKIMYISGQIPYTAAGELAGDTIEIQTEQCILNLKAILEQEGLTIDNMVKVNIYLKDMGDFAKVNEIYGKYFSESKPARAAVEVARLPLDVNVEMEGIAVYND
jgi:2-iminobutanoate/2-iminopropanoate deaminase